MSVWRASTTKSAGLSARLTASATGNTSSSKSTSYPKSTARKLESILNGPIVGPCRAGAKVYGCDITSAGFVNGVKAVNSDYAMTGGYALTGLSIEALFLKKTIASLRTVLGKIVARLSTSYSSGSACAAADGPLPIGDIIGIVMAAGGTVWSAYDLYQVKTQLGPEMKNLLQQSVQECQAACRMEALK